MLPGGRAEVAVSPDLERPGVLVTARLTALADVPALVARVRRMFDLDADSVAIDSALSADPVLAPLVASVPGIRIAGHVDGEEALFRTLIGQQISVAAARTVLGRLVVGPRRGHAVPVRRDDRRARRRGAARSGDAHRQHPACGGCGGDGELRLDVETPAAELRERLLALPGIGPWTADYLAMRVLGNPDVLITHRPGGPPERRGAGAARRDRGLWPSAARAGRRGAATRRSTSGVRGPRRPVLWRAESAPA